MKKIVLFVTLLLLGVGHTAQAQRLERFFYSDYYFSVEEAMRVASQKHAVYSYIIANASTPGVDLVALLPADDRAKLKDNIPPEADKQREVVLEFVLLQMTENNKKLMAYTTIWGNKAKSLKNIVTLGK